MVPRADCCSSMSLSMVAFHSSSCCASYYSNWQIRLTRPIAPRWYKSKMWSRSSTETQSFSDFRLNSYADPASRSAKTPFAFGSDLPFSPPANFIIFALSAFDFSIRWFKNWSLVCYAVSWLSLTFFSSSYALWYPWLSFSSSSFIFLNRSSYCFIHICRFSSSWRFSANIVP